MRFVADVIHFVRVVMSNITAAVNLIVSTYASIAAAILDIAGTTIAVRSAAH